jgi:hypothetical protein
VEGIRNDVESRVARFSAVGQRRRLAHALAPIDEKVQWAARDRWLRQECRVNPSGAHCDRVLS